jgi:hypothetical protein
MKVRELISELALADPDHTVAVQVVGVDEQGFGTLLAGPVDVSMVLFPSPGQQVVRLSSRQTVG